MARWLKRLPAPDISSTPSSEMPSARKQTIDPQARLSTPGLQQHRVHRLTEAHHAEHDYGAVIGAVDDLMQRISPMLSQVPATGTGRWRNPDRCRSRTDLNFLRAQRLAKAF